MYLFSPLSPAPGTATCGCSLNTDKISWMQNKTKLLMDGYTVVNS